MLPSFPLRPSSAAQVARCERQLPAEGRQQHHRFLMADALTMGGAQSRRQFANECYVPVNSSGDFNNPKHAGRIILDHFTLGRQMYVSLNKR